MSDLFLKDLSEAVVKEIERRAAQHGHSAEDEARAALEQQFRPPAKDFWERADKLRAELRERGLHFDSAEIIRQDRDSR
jgi:plasmid stability protein